MSIETLVQTYGYPALLLGTILEGETILVLAGYAAFRGYLSLPWVIVVAIIGSMIGDQTWFFVGRVKGRGFIKKRPRMRERANWVSRQLVRHQMAISVGFRFIYGVRNITPVLLGAIGLSPVRFAFLNAVGAVLWSVVVGAAGYLFGHTVELVLSDVKRYEMIVVLLLILLGVAYWGIEWLRHRGNFWAGRSKAAEDTKPQA